ENDNTSQSGNNPFRNKIGKGSRGKLCIDHFTQPDEAGIDKIHRISRPVIDGLEDEQEDAQEYDIAPHLMRQHPVQGSPQPFSSVYINAEGLLQGVVDEFVSQDSLLLLHALQGAFILGLEVGSLINAVSVQVSEVHVLSDHQPQLVQ